MPRLALIAAAAVAAALGLASAASAATGPAPAPTPAPDSLSAMKTGTVNSSTIQPSAGTPVSFTAGQLTPVTASAKNLLVTPATTGEPDIDDYNETFDRALDIIRQMQSMRDRMINGMG